jgi:coenzyme F420-0:L-glutamate ligase/coenzyme F420-1:gamma-L-glutamate ligase
MNPEDADNLVSYARLGRIAGFRVARLATVDEQGRPHVVPVCFAYANRRIYIALDEKPKRLPPERLRRVRNILKNPYVQLLVDLYDEDWSTLAWIQLRGRARLVESDSIHRTAVVLLQEKYEQYRSMALDDRLLIEIMVDEIVSWSASGQPF